MPQSSSVKTTKRELSESRKKWELERRVLEAIIYFSRTPAKPSLPTISEYVLSEVANATVEYATGKEGTINYRELTFQYPYRGSYENRVWGYYNEQTKNSEKLSSEVREALNGLLRPHFVSPDGPSDPYYDTQLYSDWKGFGGGGICNVFMRSSFSLDEETLQKMRHKTLPSLSKQARDDCKAIGTLMRKYVKRDLEEIKQHYRW